MAGFDDDVVYATNVDFTGNALVAGQMTANGQLLIGASVAPFIRANTLTAGTGISIINGAGTITITNTGGGGGGGGASTLSGNSGSATEVGGVINVLGTTGITTSGSGQTLSVSPANDLAALEALSGTGYVVRTGSETYALRTFLAGSGISLSNADGVAGATTITASTTVPLSFTEDSGVATPAANNLNIVGTSAQGISTSGAGATVTITAANASAVQKGVASFNLTNFTVTAGAVASNAITVTAGVGLDTGGSVNLGGSVTLDLEVPVIVANGGTGRITLTDNGVLYGDVTSPVGMTAAGTNGQVLIAATGAPPAFATITGTQGVTLTTGANSLNIGLVNVPNSALANSAITINAGAGISVVGSPVSLGGAVTISATGTIVTQFSADSGVAVPSGNNINLLGTSAQGVSTSASGATVTFTVQNASTAVKGVASFDPADFTVSSGVVSLITTGVIETLTPDTGGAISPTANNTNVLGYDLGSISLMDTHNTGSSTLRIENRTWLTPLVVDSSTTVAARGTFSTIASAITAATSGQTIFIRPGTYTENLTLKAGVNLCAFTCDAFNPNVTIIGSCTLSSAGNVTISGIRLQTNSTFAAVLGGSGLSILTLINCYLNITNNTGLSVTNSNSSSEMRVLYCQGDIGTTGIACYTLTSNATLSLEYTDIENSGNSSTASAATAKVSTFFCRLFFPMTTSASGNIQGQFTRYSTIDTNTTTLTHAGSDSSVFRHCSFTSGTASCISSSQTVKLNVCLLTTSNTNAVTGSGTLNYTMLAFDNGAGLSISTQNTEPVGPRIAFPSTCEILSGSGSPNGSVTAPKGSLWLRTDGSSSTNRMYVNTNSGTTWTAVDTVA